jgi:hypothetical protein
MLKAFLDLKEYRKKQQEDDAAAKGTRAYNEPNASIQDTKSVATSESATPGKGNAKTLESFDGDDASSSDSADLQSGDCPAEDKERLRYQNTVPKHGCEIMPKIERGTSNLTPNIPPKAKTIEEMAVSICLCRNYHLVSPRNLK